MQQITKEDGSIGFQSNTPPVEPKSVYPGYEDYLSWAKSVIEGKTFKEQKQMLKWWRSKNAKQTWGTVKAGRMRDALKAVMGV